MRTLNEGDPGLPRGSNDLTSVLIRVGRRVRVGGDRAIEAEVRMRQPQRQPEKGRKWILPGSLQKEPALSTCWRGR